MSAPKERNERIIEEWRHKAMHRLRAHDCTPEDRKACLMYLGACKRGRWPFKWMLDNLQDVILYKGDFDPVDDGDAW